MTRPIEENASPTRNAAGRVSRTSGEAAKPNTTITARIVDPVSKAWLTGSTILAVIVVFGFAASPLVLLTLPAAFLVGLAFSSIGLVMTVLARNWDFFSFYMTLVMTPMMMISGVFFPAERLPAPLLAVAQALPL